MVIKQYDYEEFYSHVISRISEILKREGRCISMFYVPKRPSVTTQQMSIQLYRRDASGSSKNSEINSQSPNTFLSHEETISLSELEYGDYIDKKYKEKFKTKCRLIGRYDRNYMEDFIKEVATDIYDKFLKKTTSDDTKRLLDKIRKNGFESLTIEEKQILFSS